MPCDTPPPIVPLENDGNNDAGNIEELDESMYDFIDPEELEAMPNDDSIVTFEGHLDAVFTCNFDKTGQYIVTGSQDETANVYFVSSGCIKFECTGHKESVLFASFSPDSKYVSSADMSGLIQVFDVEDGNLVWNFDTFEFTWAEWLHESNVLVAGCNDGNCWKFTIPDGESHVYENSGFGSSIGATSNNDKKLAVGYSNGTVKFWDISTDSFQGSLIGPNAFGGPVTVIKYNPDDTLVVIASEDGTAKLIKVSDLKILWTITICDVVDHNHNPQDVSVETVGFCNNPSLIAVGTNCGVIGVFDISSKTRRFSVSLDSVVVKIVCDDQAPVLYAALTEGIVQAYDIRTGSMLRTWSGHKAPLLDLALSRDRTMLVTSSEDGTCKLFNTGVFDQLV